ncbi:hypothetical protein CHS0354_014540 [Potamilus streckersoni]|uniref:G-protein coupled receptors family 1 profile domain-containing protein n=1 Tax=Potamilus streckersoni TaxID=2493646 RepID=A0AAE0SA04_9BIVA|nr:hypothetical protein CHS0354_014540 [Potamilus streckersoni]
MEEANITTGQYDKAFDQAGTAISIITIITSSLSILGSSSIIIAAAWKKKILSPEILPIFQLSLADFIASILLFMICCLRVSKSHINGKSCDFITGFVTSFYVSTFLLTLAYAMEIYFHICTGHIQYGKVDASVSISGSWREKWKKATSHPFMYVVYAISWLVPFIVALIFNLITSSGNSNDSSECCMPVFHYDDDECWTDKSNDGKAWHLVSKLLFIIPLSIVIILNLVFLILIKRVLKRQLRSQGIFSFAQRQSLKSVRNKLIMYQVMFFLCWIFSLILCIISLNQNYKMADYSWVLFLQGLFGPLQGFLNSIVYGWRRDKFRKMLTERTVLVAKAGQSLTSSHL